MSTFDIVLLVLLGLGAVRGFQQGFTIELFSFLAFFIGLFLALELTIPISVQLFGSSKFFDLAAIIVFVALFVLFIIGIKAIARLIKNALDFTFLGAFDSFLGALAGAFKWAFIISVIFWVVDSVGLDIVEKYEDRTIIFPYIVGIGPVVFEWISILLPFVQNLIDDMNNLPGKKDPVFTLSA